MHSENCAGRKTALPDSINIVPPERPAAIFTAPMRVFARHAGMRRRFLRECELRLTMVFMCRRFALKHEPVIVQKWSEAPARKQ
jgi:hypothetical protein